MRAAAAVLGALLQGQLQPISTGSAKSGYQNRPTQDDLTIDWESMSAEEIGALVRASNPSFGGACAVFKNAEIRLCEVKILEPELIDEGSAKPGEVVAVNPETGVQVACFGGKRLGLNVVSMEIGYFSGLSFAEFVGLRVGDRLTGPPQS